MRSVLITTESDEASTPPTQPDPAPRGIMGVLWARHNVTVAANCSVVDGTATANGNTRWPCHWSNSERGQVSRARLWRGIVVEQEIVAQQVGEFVDQRHQPLPRNWSSLA